MAKCGAASPRREDCRLMTQLHLAGIPMVRAVDPYTISGTDIVCDGDDLHFVTMQQCSRMDDIRRNAS